MKPKLLFIDRDGTIIIEPLPSRQIDSLEKLEFIPGAISALSAVAKNTDYSFIMVTNQDGMGTASFPEDTFWPAQNKMMQTLKGEGVVFDQVHIDKSFTEENKPTRKPGIAMLTSYLSGDYDIASSYVIGDRTTDVQMAKNLGCKAIFISKELSADQIAEIGRDEACVLATSDWKDIENFLLNGTQRTARVHRQTKETDILIELNLDGTGKTNISTGLGFFDHMLDQLGRHSLADLTVQVKGDLHIDEHHTIEDTALALGEAYLMALGDKKGIERYGYMVPMDDCLAQAAIDFSGRPWLVWEAEFKREKVGDMPTEMFFHFFKSFTDTSKSNLNIKAEGDNEHHKIEAIFKALAKAIKMAVKRDRSGVLPSTKGVL